MLCRLPCRHANSASAGKVSTTCHSCLCRRSRTHATDRRTAFGISLCRQPHAAEPLGFGGNCCRLPACHNANEADAIEAIFRRPNTSKPAPGHKIYPYLLRRLPVMRPNQLWAMDIKYIPMAHGSVCLAAFVDWFSWWVLS